MKQKSRDLCKGEECGNHASGFEGSSVRPGAGSSRLVIFWVALVVWVLFFVAPASAHEGLDPEIQEITEQLAKNPNDVDLLITRAWNYRKNGKFINALADIDRANRLDPGNQEILLERGLTLSALRRDVEAEVVLDRFLDEGAAKVSGGIAARILGTTSARISERTSDKNLLLTALVERAYVHSRMNKVDMAIEDFTSAITVRPLTPLYLSRGKLQESLGQFDLAANGYREGLARVGNALQLKKGLIRVSIKRQQFDYALKLVDQELARASVKTAWYLRRAEILDMMGQEDASRMAKEKALTEANRVLRKRTTALNRLLRGKVYMALGQRPDARRDLESAVQMAPNLDEARELLGILKGQGE